MDMKKIALSDSKELLSCKEKK